MKLLSLVAAVGMVLVEFARGIPMMPETIPVDRLVITATAVLQKNPKDAEAEYTLARIHYLAFVCAETKLQAYTRHNNSPLPSVGPFQRFTTARIEGKDLPDPESGKHIAEALAHFEAAQKLAPRNSLYRLGYASLLEQASDWARRHPKADAPPRIRELKPVEIREAYRTAWQMELAADLKEKRSRGMFSPLDMVSYEAGTAFVRLCEKEKDGLSAAEKTALARVRESLGKLVDDVPRAVTPIVFATKPVLELGDLLSPETIVTFPLRGWGPTGRWPWVRPDTAILVWNPSGSGSIQSGAQLFGNYTWELFWKSGYEPLAILDANDDGELRDQELSGIGAWFDRDGNGVSDPGEVESLSNLGITALATTATETEGRHPMNRRGITFSDGRVLPTWDWVVEPLGSVVVRESAFRGPRR